MKIDNDGINSIIEEVHITNNFEKEFDIAPIFECEYNEDSNSNKE